MCETPHGGYAPHPDRPNREGCRQDRRPFPRTWSPSSGAVTHPHFNRRFGGLLSLRRRSDEPADVPPHVWRCHCRPERRVSTKCSLFPSCRGVMYRRLNGEVTKMCPLVQNPFSCTPPALRGRSPFRLSLEGDPSQGAVPQFAGRLRIGDRPTYSTENERGCDLGCASSPTGACGARQ